MQPVVALGALGGKVACAGRTRLLLVQRVLTQHFLACAAARICSAADFTRAANEKVKIGHSQTTLSLGAVPTIVSRTKPPVVLSIHVQFVRTPTALNKID
ncbi:hypothetical protein C1J02_12830 [Sulfitobacter sp. SK011]|nr:hypothetical protein C1J02_12830 [Sulfitobacter sp. SK011]